MPSLKYDIIVDGNQSRVALEQFANETDAAFKKSERAINRISMAALPEHEQAVLKVHRKYQALEAQMKQLEKSGRITKDQAAKWSSGLTAGMEREISAVKALGSESTVAAGRVKQFDRNFMEMTGRILASAPAFAVATAAIAGVYGAIRAGANEIKLGIKSVEDYKMNVIKMAAVMTNFSEKAKEGDIAGAWADALPYSKRLVEDLEMIDAKSAASGENITNMVAKMANYGVVVDVNSEKQRTAVVALADAIQMLTGDQQNASQQFSQEIKSLMEGVAKAGSPLASMLEQAGLNIKTFASEVRAGKKDISDLLPYLSGFTAASKELESTWTTVGSTLDTIHKRILRAGFMPVADDILKWAREIRDYYMEQNGQLTLQGKLLHNDIADGWDNIRLGAISVKAEIIRMAMLLDKIGGTMTFISSLPSAIPAAIGIDSSEARMQRLADLNIMFENRYADNDRMLADLAQEYNRVEDRLNSRTIPTGGSSTAPPPKMANIPGKEELEAAEKLAEKWSETQRKLSDDVKLAGFDGLNKDFVQLQKDLAQIDINAAKMRAEFGNRVEIDTWATSMKDAATSTANLKLETELYENVSTLADEKMKETTELLKQQNEQMEELSLAVLPEYIRKVEEITRKYGDWERQIEDLAGAGRLTMEEAQEWVDGLGVSMAEEYRGLAAKSGETAAEVSEFWKEGMRDMQNFSQQFFFDAMKGNFDDLGSRFEDMILNMVANWQAAQLQMVLWGTDQTAGSGLGNGLISAVAAGISSYFSSGTNISSPAYIDALDSFYTAPGFAKGGVMTGAGPLPLRRYTAGGVANSPQLAIYGEGSRPEAYVPLEDGRTIPVTMNGGGGGDVTVTIINYSSEQATKREYQTASGGRAIEVQIGEAAAANYLQRGALYKAINSSKMAGR
jgi:hypothetical protein